MPIVRSPILTDPEKLTRLAIDLHQLSKELTRAGEPTNGQLVNQVATALQYKARFAETSQ